MKNIKWIINGIQYTLRSDEEVLVELTMISGRNPVFKMNEAEYVMSHKGFWNPSYLIFSKQEEIVKITHSLWRSIGKITLKDGEVFISEYSNKGGLTLTLLQEDKEILHYSIRFENKKPTLNFTIGTSIVDADKLLLLSAIGMIMFSSIYKEIASGNDTSSKGFITAVIA